MSPKIPAKDLKDLFISTFKDEKSLKYEAGNPFLMKLKAKEYYVFLKNISSAYYKKYPDNARIQLPFSPHFKKISESNFDFIILGYDSVFQTFSAWDPHLIKARLNVRGNVSLFTRFSFQKKCKLNQFKEHHISDGTRIVLFSTKSTPQYFNSYKSIFDNTKQNEKFKFKKLSAKNLLENEDKLNSIEDPTILKSLKKLLKNDNKLEAVNLCALNYQEKSPKMILADWFNLVEKYQT